MKLVIFSICLNEEKTIGELIQRIPKKIDGIDKIEIIVIDDGSTDKTIKIAQNLGVEVFSNIMQKRLAFSFQKAIDIALAKEADIAVNIDGDLQYAPEDIPLLVRPILEDKVDCAAATRFTNNDGSKRAKPENMPIGNYLGNKCGSWVISKLTGQNFVDVTSGFRAYSRNALLAININSKYTYTQEAFQVLATKGLTIRQVPVAVKYYQGRKSRVVLGFFSFILGSAINILRSFRDFAPLWFFGLSGLISFSFGAGLSLFMLTYYAIHRTFTPYKFIGFAGVFFVSFGIIIWIVGLVGDMLDRILNNQEKIIRLLKETKYKEGR